jgi:hypothetical protein
MESSFAKEKENQPDDLSLVDPQLLEFIRKLIKQFEEVLNAPSPLRVPQSGAQKVRD